MPNTMDDHPRAGLPAIAGDLVAGEAILIADPGSQPAQPGNDHQVMFGRSGHRSAPSDASLRDQHVAAVSQAI